MVFTINTSPFAGREGQYVTSRDLRARLERELLTNVSLRVEDMGTTDAFRVLGRGELQLAILIETMRREGYELMVGKPEIVVRTENGRRVEPLELLVIDCPETFIGIVMELARHAPRRNEKNGEPSFRPRAHGVQHSVARLDRIARPASHRHARHRPDPFDPRRLDGLRRRHGHASHRRARRDRPGVSVAYALWGIQERGEMFVGPGIEVYEGMIVGENAREDDMNVNVTKEKKQTNMRSSSADEAIRLIPPREMTLEKAIEFIADDEFVEVTPKSIRLRKKVLDAKRRPKRWQEIKASAEAAS